MAEGKLYPRNIVPASLPSWKILLVRQTARLRGKERERERVRQG